MDGAVGGYADKISAFDSLRGEFFFVGLDVGCRLKSVLGVEAPGFPVKED